MVGSQRRIRFRRCRANLRASTWHYVSTSSITPTVRISNNSEQPQPHCHSDRDGAYATATEESAPGSVNLASDGTGLLRAVRIDQYLAGFPGFQSFHSL